MKLFIFIAGAISKESPLNLKTANNILRKGMFTTLSNSYMVKSIPIIECDFKI